MHLFFVTRGINQQREIWKSFLQSQFFPWERTNLDTNEKQQALVQGALRPIELWEYVFPEEHLNEVCSAMGIVNPDNSINYGDFAGYKKAMLPFLRKALGADKLPKELQFKPTNRVMRVEGFGPNIIGYKKDNKKDYDFGKAGRFNQEGL